MKKLQNRLILFLLICLLFSVGCLSSNPEDRRTADLAEPTPIPTAVTAARPTYEVSQGTVTFTIDFSGRVVPMVEEDLIFSRDGIVKTVYVGSGDEVKAGNLIADLDTAGWEAELVLAQAALDVAEGLLANSQQQIAQERQAAELERDLAQLDLDYAVQTAGDNPTAEEQYQIDRLTLLLAVAQLKVDALDSVLDPELQSAVDIAALRVAELESLIDNSELLAPFDGQISSLTISRGRSVEAFEPVGIIAEPAELEISANLQGAELQNLAEGMLVDIDPVGIPGETLQGSIVRLPSPFGSGDEDSPARIQFNHEDVAFDQYESGDRVRLSVVVTERNEVLWLPPAAIRDFNGRKFVVVQTEGIEQRVDVTLGIEGDGRVEIVSGLEAGQVIVGQ